MARSRRTTAAIALGTSAVVALGLAQLALPRIAAQRVSDKLGRYGTVQSAAVEAWPAIELLWGHAQSATARAGYLAMTLREASELLTQAKGIERVDAHVRRMRLEGLAMHEVALRKRGDELRVEGRMAEDDLRAALPGSVAVEPLGSVEGRVEVRVRGSIFGANAAVEALLGVEDGKLVAQSLGIPLAGALRLTLLAAPHVYLQSFQLDGPASGAAAGDRSYLVKISAQLR